MTFTSILIPLVGGILLVAFPRLFTKATGEALNRATAKLRRIGYLLLGVAGIYCVVKVGESFAQPDAAAKPQMEMHRLQATTPGDSGWYLAESTHGSFSVLLPIPFNDFTLTATDPKSGTIKTYTVGAQSTEGMKFSATEMPIIPGKTPPDFDQIPRSLSTDGQQISDVGKASFSGWPSISLSVVGPRSGAYIRYVRTGVSVITLILEYPAAHRSEAALLKSRFLDSLKIKTPNPAASGNGATGSSFHAGRFGRAAPEPGRP
jgi:uncharacterized protein YjeT (DUF2065 family)